MTLVLRKLLASSTFAIAGALTTMSNRLKKALTDAGPVRSVEEDLAEDFEALDELTEEWGDESPPGTLTAAERAAMEDEIAELDAFADLATHIEHNAKGTALLKALGIAMESAAALGAARKAIIFTESRRTQDYLVRLLQKTEWRDGIVLFNGSNSDPQSRRIYAEWLAKHKGTDRVTGSRTADMRSALVDEFRERGQVMIATEAAAEGINLQFCSLVVNYDLPWNPQRIEQRIGRCHRYGQKHDVVVVNFLNKANAADQRVHQLLTEKFNLFEGVFGASDEVLGAIESGVDFEKRINEIYQRCRTTEEIDDAFRQLQLDLAPEINAQMTQTRQKLLEHFDDEVRERLRLQQEESRKAVGRFERLLMRLTEHELAGDAHFHDDGSFELLYSPDPDEIPTGRYELPRRSDDAHIYRVSHPLAEEVIARAKQRELPPAEVVFNLSAYEGKISALEQYKGMSGQLTVSLLAIDSLDQTEEHLIYAAMCDNGDSFDDDLIRDLLRLPACANQLAMLDAPQALDAIVARRQAEIVERIGARNLSFFQEETEKLDAWADDLKAGLEREIKELDRQIREARRQAKSVITLEDKLAAQKMIKSLETERNHKRRSLFDAQDEVDAQREELIAAIESKLNQAVKLNRLFSIRWTLE
jgi:adenine-specific DNA-methyltransferase